MPVELNLADDPVARRCGRSGAVGVLSGAAGDELAMLVEDPRSDRSSLVVGDAAGLGRKVMVATATCSSTKLIRLSELIRSLRPASGPGG